MKKIILMIDGMTCSACSNGLEKYLNKQSGISNATVNLVMSNALVEYDEKILNIEKIEEFVKQAGFKSLGEFKDINQEKKSKNEKINLIIFIVLSIILMYVSMGKMMGLPILKFLDYEKNPVNFAVCLLLLTIPFLIYGFDIIKSGIKNLIHKTPNMDTLVAIGVLSSFIYSIYGMIKIINGEYHFAHNLYFESSAIVIFFIKLGRYIDKLSKNKTKQAIQKLVQITPKNAIIKVNGEERQVTIDEIKKGDILICKPGEKIAVDGEIISGKAHFDEAFITGESKPVNKTIGNKVIAGSINFDGYIEYKAEKIGKESTISEIVRLVVEATNTKAPIAKVADKVCGYFVPTVILIAIVSLVVYLCLGYDLGNAVNVFVTILVVACPCSLGLATPLAIVVSEGRCASCGILVKKSEILEIAQKIDTVVFDKTGTLTYGTLKISEIINYSKMLDKQIMQIAGSLENKSTHPIGKAFTEYLEENKLEILKVKDFKEESGLGISGLVNNENIILGNSKILLKYNIENKYIEDENRLSEKGNSIIYVVKNNEVIGIIGVNDIIRENANQVIEYLNSNKIKTIMLTGDNSQTANKIASKVGIKEVISNVMPQEKTKIIQNLKQENKFIMMCGDGINDSPAIATADVGVSISGATDVAQDSADVILTNSNIYGIVNLIKISRKTIKNIKQNLFWAFFYNILMIPIAIGILRPVGIIINPMIASVAMMLSSITVILNTLRLRK